MKFMTICYLCYDGTKFPVCYLFVMKCKVQDMKYRKNCFDILYVVLI